MFCVLRLFLHCNFLHSPYFWMTMTSVLESMSLLSAFLMICLGWRVAGRKVSRRYGYYILGYNLTYLCRLDLGLSHVPDFYAGELLIFSLSTLCMLEVTLQSSRNCSCSLRVNFDISYFEFIWVKICLLNLSLSYSIIYVRQWELVGVLFYIWVIYIATLFILLAKSIWLWYWKFFQLSLVLLWYSHIIGINVLKVT